MFTLMTKLLIDCVPDRRRPVINLRDPNVLQTHPDEINQFDLSELVGAMALVPITYINDDERLRNQHNISGLPTYMPVWNDERIGEFRILYRTIVGGILKSTHELRMGGFLNPGFELHLLFSGQNTIELVWGNKAIDEIYRKGY